MKKWLSWLKDQIVSHPTAIAGGISMILGYIVSQGLVSWSSEQVGLIGAVVTALLALLAGALTDRFGVAMFIALGNAVAALIVGFDTGAGAKSTAAIIGVVAFALGLIHHGKASPKYGRLAQSRVGQTVQAVHVLNQPIPVNHHGRVIVANPSDLGAAIADAIAKHPALKPTTARATAKRTAKKMAAKPKTTEAS